MTDSSDLKVLFLDIDDTLFGTTDFVQKARAAAVDAMIKRGLQADKERVLKTLAAVVAEFGSNDDHHYNRLLQRMPKSCTAGANHDLLIGAGVIAYHNTKWEELRIKPEAEDLLRDLAATPLRLGVISAGLVHKQVEKVLRLGIDRYLDKDLLFITHAVGIAKSNPRLYARCIEHADVEPGQAMHVGDHPYHDVDAANAAGLRTVWLRGSGKYSTLLPHSEPDYVIDEFVELRALLREHYALQV